MSAIYDAMHPYQRTGAYHLKRRGNALLADQPGLGKTIQTLGTIIARQRTDGEQEWHLIVCPSVAVKSVWANEIKRWLFDHDTEVLALHAGLSLKQREAAVAAFRPIARHVFVVTNIEACRIKVSEIELPNGEKKKVHLTENALLPMLFERVWDTIVVDESHRALIRKTGVPSATRAGFMRLQSRRRIALSGTPMRGKPEQLWGTFNWLEPDVYTSYWKWVKRYFYLDSNGFSNYVLGDWLPDGEKRLAADNYASGIMLRRTKAEVAKDLPPKTYAGSFLIDGDEHSPFGVWLTPSPKQARQLKQFDLDAVVVGDDEELMAQGALAVGTRSKQLAHGVHNVVNGKLVLDPTDSVKLEWLLDWLDNAGGAQIVVASQFTSVLNIYADVLAEKGYSVGLLTGQTSQNSRPVLVENFQAGKIQVFLLNTYAGGVALTLDSADYLVLLDETYIPDEQEQVEDRIHRVSRVHNVTIYYLRVLGTIEEEVAYVVAARENVQKYLLDGARGVETAKALYLNKMKGAA